MSDTIQIEAFDAYLAKRVSDSNRKSCVRVIKKLASGEGVTHKNKPGETFHGDHVLTLSDDIASIQKQAAVWLPFRKGAPDCLDPGHGWALNHPLMWLGHFKAWIKDPDSEDDQVLLPNRRRAAPTAGKLTVTMNEMPPAKAVPLSAKQMHDKIALGVPVVAAVEIVKKSTPPPKRKRAESDASKMAEELCKEKAKNKKLARELCQYKKNKSEGGAAAASKMVDDQGVEISCGILIEDLD